MARTTGVSHATYKLTTGEGIDPSALALHSSKLAALEHAVDHEARYVPWPHGKTLAEAIEAYQAVKIANAGRAEREARRPAAASTDGAVR